jgi:hypothetical protein
VVQTVTALRIGVDIGGTFTDLCVLDESGVVAVGKVLTTHDEPARAVESVLVDTLREAGLSTVDVERFVHGTTLVTNALIERKDSRTALLATAGFSDVLEMRREHRYELYDLLIELPTPLVPRHLRFDVPERVLADGAVRTPLDEDYVARLGTELAERGIDAVAVCFLHAFTNPGHDRRTAEILRSVAPGSRVAMSSEVVPEIREFERTSTTVANVYVQDLTERYLRDLERRLRRAGIGPSPHIMLSNGGIAMVDTAARYPIRIVDDDLARDRGGRPGVHAQRVPDRRYRCPRHKGRSEHHWIPERASVDADRSHRDNGAADTTRAGAAGRLRGSGTAARRGLAKTPRWPHAVRSPGVPPETSTVRAVRRPEWTVAVTARPAGSASPAVSTFPANDGLRCAAVTPSTSFFRVGAGTAIRRNERSPRCSPTWSTVMCRSRPHVRSTASRCSTSAGPTRSYGCRRTTALMKRKPRG